MLLFIKILIFGSAKLLIYVIQLEAGKCLSVFSLFSCWKSLQCMLLQYFLSLLASYVALMVCIQTIDSMRDFSSNDIYYVHCLSNIMCLT